MKKDIATSFLKMIIAGEIPEAFEKYVGPGFKHHNPYSTGDADALVKGMQEAHVQFPKKVFEMQHVLEDGNIVSVHSKLQMGDVTMAVVHIFRFEGDRIVEFWDVGQQVPKDNPNENGMF